MPSWPPRDIDLVKDPTEAEWVISRLRPWHKDGVRVASFMPDVFDAYARIFHPAGGRGADEQGRAWSELAAKLSKPIRPDMQFHELVERGQPLHDIEPLAGSLPIVLLSSLVHFLGRWTKDNDACWFAMWDGNGTWWKGAHGGDHADDDERDRTLRAIPRAKGEHRAYFLMRGPLNAVVALYDAAGSQSPALWWPADRSWLVSTEVDAFSSYLGGSSAMIGDLVNADGVEATTIGLNAPLDSGL